MTQCLNQGNAKKAFLGVWGKEASSFFWEWIWEASFSLPLDTVEGGPKVWNRRSHPVPGAGPTVWGGERQENLDKRSHRLPIKPALRPAYLSVCDVRANKCPFVYIVWRWVFCVKGTLKWSVNEMETRGVIRARDLNLGGSNTKTVLKDERFIRSEEKPEYPRRF